MKPQLTLSMIGLPCVSNILTMYRNTITNLAHALSPLTQQLGILLTFISPYLNALEMGLAPRMARPVEPLTFAPVRHIISPSGIMTFQIQNEPLPVGSLVCTRCLIV